MGGSMLCFQSPNAGGWDVYVLYYARQNAQIGIETGYVKRSKVMAVANAPLFHSNVDVRAPFARPIPTSACVCKRPLPS